MGIEGQVFVSFVVDSEGKISEVTTIKGISADCDKEAVRVVQMMPPGRLVNKTVNRLRFASFFPSNSSWVHKNRSEI